jgi:hypothetical protein
MEFAEALRRRLPLQVRLPVHSNPLKTNVRYAAEVFMVETAFGPAVVWLDPFWCNDPTKLSCHIAYASPKEDADNERWIDKDPRYGPFCLVSQKPFVMEPLDSASPAWGEYKAWRSWRRGRAEHFGRKAAWDAAQHAFQELRIERRV